LTWDHLAPVQPAAVLSPHIIKQMNDGDVERCMTAMGEPGLQPRTWRTGDIIQDKDGPVMIVVPQGKYQMGSPDNEEERFEDEGPAHVVQLEYDLAVAKYAVTRGEWRRYADDTGRRTTTDGDWLAPGFPQDDHHPAVCMSWDEAQAYIAWLSQKTGQHYRMLSEAEYEYMNRAGTRTRYFWADSNIELPLHASRNGTGTTPVGSLKPNPWGLHDTTGNVWSWTQDTWHDTYDCAPTDGSAWEAGGSDAHVIRGGSWSDFAWMFRSASRACINSGCWYVGLRLARTP
jgi:formylglycine-generating enzyme required for sulfatase activity